MNIFEKLPSYTYVTIKYHLSKYPQFNKQLTLVTLSLLVSFILVPILFIGLASSLIFKKLVDIYLKSKLKHLYRGQLRGVDAICCNQKACTPSIFFFIDYRKTHEDLRQDFVNILRQSNYPRHEKLFYSWSTFLGFHYYYRNTLSIEEMVIVSQYGCGISKIRSKQDFAEVIIHHDTEPMPDDDHALLQIIVYPQEVLLPNVEGCTLVCIKLHHTLGDGKAMFSWFMSDLADKDNEVTQMKPKIANSVGTMTQDGCLTGRCSMENFTHSLKQTLFHDKIQAMPTDFQEDNILLGKNISDEKFICWFNDSSTEYIDKIKAIRRSRTGASFLDVINTCISCSLNDYYYKRCPEVPSTISAAVVLSPKEYSFRYGSSDFAFINEFSIGGFHYPLALNQNGGQPNKNREILERFDFCQKEYQAIKDGIDVKYFYWLSHVFSSIPCQLPTYFSQHMMKVSIGVSSLPGSDRKISLFGGNLLKDAIFMPPNSPGTGLHFVNSSYGNRFKISLTIDKSIEGNFEAAQSIIDGIIGYIDCLYAIISENNK